MTEPTPGTSPDYLVVEHDTRKLRVRPYTDGEIARIGTINDIAAIALAVLTAVIGAGIGLILDLLPPTMAILAVLFLVGGGAGWVLKITRVPATRWFKN